MKCNVAVIPGDGIGPDIVAEAIKVLKTIGEKYGKSVAQIILRWNLQKGVVVIPGSSNPDHIKENTGIYHFELSKSEMERINALNRDEKHDWY